MPRMTFSLPENIHQQILKLAEEEHDSISYTVTRLVEIGLMVLQAKSQKNDEKNNELEEYCQKLIIQMNGIIKELVINQFNFDKEKISTITNETIVKFNKLKRVQETL